MIAWLWTDLCKLLHQQANSFAFAGMAISFLRAQHRRWRDRQQPDTVYYVYARVSHDSLVMSYVDTMSTLTVTQLI